MTMQSRSNRYYWRQRNRRLLRLINALLAIVVAALLLLPVAATAAPACPGSLRPNANGQCVRQIDRRTVCAWPLRVAGQRITVCDRQAAEVQP